MTTRASRIPSADGNTMPRFKIFRGREGSDGEYYPAEEILSTRSLLELIETWEKLDHDFPNVYMAIEKKVKSYKRKLKIVEIELNMRKKIEDLGYGM